MLALHACLHWQTCILFWGVHLNAAPQPLLAASEISRQGLRKHAGVPRGQLHKGIFTAVCLWQKAALQAELLLCLVRWRRALQIQHRVLYVGLLTSTLAD